VFVQSGTVNADTAWTQTTDNPTVGSSNIVWAAFGAGGGTTYTAGDGLSLTGSDFAVNTGTGLEISSDAVRIAASAAGAGLTGGAGSALAVGAGDGISVAADAVAVDSTVSRRYSTGTHASSTSITITHSLGVQYCSGVSVYVTSTGELVDCDVTATSTTQMTFGFATAPTANTLTFSICT
jgi:hypothetical protein